MRTPAPARKRRRRSAAGRSRSRSSGRRASGSGRRCQLSARTSRAPRSHRASAGSRAARCENASSSTTTFASRASSRLKGSMFDEPTVAHVPIDHRDLRVQEALVVLVDLDAGVEQRAVQRARRVMQQPVLDASLQEQHHAHAARGGFGERVPKREAREKNTSSRSGSRSAPRAIAVEIRVLDVVAVPEVVAHEERRALRAAQPRRRGAGPRRRASRRRAA